MCFIATDWHKAELEQTSLSRTQLIQKAMTDGKVSKLSLNCTSEPSHSSSIRYRNVATTIKINYHSLRFIALMIDTNRECS